MACLDFLLTLCLLGFIIQLSKGFKLYNNELSEEQAKTLFRRSSVGDVPQYHTVHVETFSKHRSRRSAEHDFRVVQFEIDGKKYNLKLVSRKRPVFTFTTPVRMITSVPGQNPNYTYKIVDQEDVFFDGIFFKGEEMMANLLAHYDRKQQQILYDGIFGLGTETHVIRSVPEKWRIISRPTENNKRLSKGKSNEHVVYKTQNHNKISRSAFLTVEDPEAMDKLDKPVSVLHVKILPVIDYELFKLLKESVQETLKYISTFWTAVDMQYSKIDMATIEITVTGVIIATDEHALSFIDKSRNKMNSSKLNPYELLEEARIYFYENFIKDTNLTNYDAIFVMTALNTKPTAGMSYIGRICNRLYSTAFIQDNASYLGLHSATHELGHLLNFVHDGSDEAKDCQPYSKDGESTIMAPVFSKATSFVWSQCSKNSLEEFVKTKAAKCLRETYRIK